MTTVNKFQRGKIYTIRSHQTDKIYIGSTIETLSRRLAQHKTHYKCWKDGKATRLTSFKLLDYEDVYIELLEAYPCNSRDELHKKEGEYIRSMDCVNKRIEGRTMKEWDNDNRNKRKEIQKRYRENHPERVKQFQKEYRNKNKDRDHERYKDYHQKNKNKIHKRKAEKMICECGTTLSKSSLSQHRKRKVHQDFISLLWWN